MKSVAIIAGEQGTEVMGMVVPVLEAVGQFNYQTAFGSATTRDIPGLPPGAVELAQYSEATIVGRLEGATEVSTDPVHELQAALRAQVVLQPVKVSGVVAELSPLKPEKAEGTDMMVVHALGDAHFGPKGRDEDGTVWDRAETSAAQIRNAARVAFNLAQNRAAVSGELPRVLNVDKANVMETSKLWRDTVKELQSREFPEVRLRHLLADIAARDVPMHPHDHDVVLSNNLFGDILAGSTAAISHKALTPSATLNLKHQGIYRPARPEGAGGAPAIILSTAMALRYSLKMSEAADRVEEAVQETLESGALTPELGGEATAQEFTDEVVQYLNGEGI